MITEGPRQGKAAFNQPLVEYAIYVAAKAVRSLRKETHLDEANFRRFAPYLHAKCSAFFAYRVLDEITKVGMNLMQWSEYFSEGINSKKEDDEIGRGLSRLAIETVIDDQHARIRKMTELLVECILFGESTPEHVYRDYFLIHALSDIVQDQCDCEEYFGFRREKMARAAEMLYKDIVSGEEAGLDPSCRWYLDHPGRAKPKWLDKAPKSASFAKKYKLAISAAKPREHMILGKSYREAYHGSSRDIHFTPHDTSSDFRSEDGLSNMRRIAWMLINIVYRCQDIIGAVPQDVNKQLRDILDSSRFSDEFVQWLRDPKLEAGDIVIVNDQIAEIVDIRISPHNFTAVKVYYLDKSLVNEIPFDWFASFEVRKYVKHEQVERVAIDAKEIIKRNIGAMNDFDLHDYNELLDYAKEGMTQIYRVQYQELREKRRAAHRNGNSDNND